MAKLIDMTGKVFGALTVICRSSSNYRRRATWECLCKCGNKTRVHGDNLRSGHTKSCGCVPRAKSLITSQVSKLKLEGAVSGFLTYIKDDPNNRIKVLCQCGCGNIKSVYRQGFITGRLKSCGCYRKTAMRIDIQPGTIFGLLTTTGRSETKRDRKDKIKLYWECRCACGTFTKVESYNLRFGLSKTCGGGWHREKVSNKSK